MSGQAGRSIRAARTNGRPWRVCAAPVIGASNHAEGYAVLQPTESRSPHLSDIVAALIDGEVTLKRYTYWKACLFEGGESQVP